VEILDLIPPFLIGVDVADEDLVIGDETPFSSTSRPLDPLGVAS